MAKKHKGSLDELKAVVEQTGTSGEWRELANGQYQFKANDGAILNWWSSKGTLQFQGSPDEKAAFEQAFDLVLAGDSSGSKRPVVAPASDSKRIFVVHGHDTVALDQLELILHRLDLKPFILMNTSGEGKTIIECLEGQIGRDYTSAFGIVLMTPDDMGYGKKDGPDKAEPRARQNVILETGMLLASLTRKHMVLLVKGHLERPSDLEGIIYAAFNDHVKEVVPKLCQRLREAGFEINPDMMARATV